MIVRDARQDLLHRFAITAPLLRIREPARPTRSEIPGNEPISPRPACAGIALHTMSFIEVHAWCSIASMPGQGGPRRRIDGAYTAMAHVCAAAPHRRDGINDAHYFWTCSRAGC